MMTTTKLAEIVSMLVDVARAAHYAMDDCGDLTLTEEGSARLSNALDALDELPEIDDGYVRDGWCKAKDWLIALNAYTTPQPSADAVRELVRRWRECAKSAANGPMFDGASEYAVAGTYIACADELESLLSAASGEKGVG